ncbi:hypothetical protein HHSLTHF2_19170 [Vreelandella venusta]|uniref:Uncharacterized protein n=1 Tax=Halomonas hydrothermalis TaxID=115561 RepID=A0A6F8U2Z2_9GAMM|nr:hypothetical protein HHSLTHF2_19170 [Halomonas hydrothermalis]
MLPTQARNVTRPKPGVVHGQHPRHHMIHIGNVIQVGQIGFAMGAAVAALLSLFLLIGFKANKQRFDFIRF